MKNDRPKENEKAKYKDFLDFPGEIVPKEGAIPCPLDCVALWGRRPRV